MRFASTSRCAWLAASLAFLGSSAESFGQILQISIGNLTLDGDPKEILVQNLTANPVEINALQFNLEVTTTPGGAVRPSISSIDLKTGSIFQSESSLVDDNSVNSFNWSVGIVRDGSSPTPTVPANSSSRIALVTFSTAGVSPGSWGLLLTTSEGATTFTEPLLNNTIPTTLVDGTISVVPEPSAYAAVFAAGSLVFGVSLRRIRARREATAHS